MRFYLSVIGLHHNAFATVQNAVVPKKVVAADFFEFTPNHQLPAAIIFTRFIYKMVESSCSIASATNTNNDVIRIFSSDFLFQLPFNFLRNHTLESRHQIWKRMRINYTSDDVMRSSSIVNPVS